MEALILTEQDEVTIEELKDSIEFKIASFLYDEAIVINRMLRYEIRRVIIRNKMEFCGDWSI